MWSIKAAQKDGCRFFLEEQKCCRPPWGWSCSLLTRPRHHSREGIFAEKNFSCVLSISLRLRSFWACDRAHSLDQDTLSLLLLCSLKVICTSPTTNLVASDHHLVRAQSSSQNLLGQVSFSESLFPRECVSWYVCLWKRLLVEMSVLDNVAFSKCVFLYNHLFFLCVCVCVLVQSSSSKSVFYKRFFFEKQDCTHIPPTSVDFSSVSRTLLPRSILLLLVYLVLLTERWRCFKKKRKDNKRRKNWSACGSMCWLFFFRNCRKESTPY